MTRDLLRGGHVRKLPCQSFDDEGLCLRQQCHVHAGSRCERGWGFPVTNLIGVVEKVLKGSVPRFIAFCFKNHLIP